MTSEARALPIWEALWQVENSFCGKTKKKKKKKKKKKNYIFKNKNN